MANVGSNFFKAYLASELTEGGSETEFFLDRITTLTGETITTSLFSTFGRGTITIAPTVADSIECASFTGVDANAVSLTGGVRGLSALSDSVVAANKKYHPVGTQVIIAFGIHNLNDLTTYIANLVTGSIGTATDLVGGSTKLTEGLGVLPRATAALVSEQTTPNMTLKVNPFAIAVLDTIVSYTGGNTSTFTAPVSNPRIDLIVYRTGSSDIAVRTGTEGVSPTEPTPTSGDIVLASVYHRVGETTLRERDISPNTQGYIKRWYRPDVYRTDLATQTYVGTKIKFGGTGADGALAITSGTTTIDLGGAQVFVKNYTSISITGTGALAFTNPHANGTTVILKSQGDVTITSSASAAIDVSSLGSAGVTLRGGTSGRGGGALYVECAGSLNFASPAVIKANGGDATQSTQQNGKNAGGGPGAVLMLYNTLTANTGTIQTNSGTDSAQQSSNFSALSNGTNGNISIGMTNSAYAGLGGGNSGSTGLYLPSTIFVFSLYSKTIYIIPGSSGGTGGLQSGPSYLDGGKGQGMGTSLVTLNTEFA